MDEDLVVEKYTVLECWEDTEPVIRVFSSVTDIEDYYIPLHQDGTFVSASQHADDRPFILVYIPNEFNWQKLDLVAIMDLDCTGLVKYDSDN